MGKNFGFRSRPGVPPPPGSPAAKAQGCTCPGPENEAQAEAAEQGEVAWFMDSTCPVHRIPKRIQWLREMQQRRESGHPETVHLVVLDLHTDDLLAAQLQAMAEVQGVELVTLLNRYLGQGLEADLDKIP